MPTNVVKTPEDEEKWQKAKAIAGAKGEGENYAYIMGIYKRMNPERFAAARVVARFENLRKTDRPTVYHGTDLQQIPHFINGFDATKMKGRLYNTRPHKGVFVSPELATAKKFGDVILELDIPARFLHGRDWAGKPLHPKKQEQAEKMFPDSFRPHLSWTLESGEPQALVLGLVSPRQIRRVFYDGKWYSRKDFLALDLESWGTRRRPMRDLGVDVSDPSLSWEDFVEATAILLGQPAARTQKGLERLIEQGKSPDWAEKHLGVLWEPIAARRYAERFFGAGANRRAASLTEAYGCMNPHRSRSVNS